MNTHVSGVFAVRAGIVVMAFLSSSCGRFDRTKFEPSYRAGKALESAIAVGVNYQKLSELTQTFATEIAIATDAAKTEDEKGSGIGLRRRSAPLEGQLDSMGLEH